VIKVIWLKAALPAHVDGSVIFTRWCRCAPYLIRASMGSPELSQTASGSFQPFLHISQQRVPVLYSWPHLLPMKIAPLHGGSGSPSNTRFLGPTWVHNPNSISIITRFCRTHDCDRPTDHVCYSGRIYVVLHCGLQRRPIKEKLNVYVLLLINQTSLTFVICDAWGC